MLINNSYLPVSPTFFRQTKHLFFFVGLLRGVSDKEVLASSEGTVGEACRDAGRSDRGVAATMLVPPATCIHAAIEERKGERGRESGWIWSIEPLPCLLI